VKNYNVVSYELLLLKAGSASSQFSRFTVLSVPVFRRQQNLHGAIPQRKSSPSVVNIIALKVIRSPGQGAAPLGPEDPMRDFFERFFGRDPKTDLALIKNLTARRSEPTAICPSWWHCPPSARRLQWKSCGMASEWRCR
jgi:hypothetical protein